MTPKFFLETTLKRNVTLSGKALFSGSQTEITLLPAPTGEGIVFKKITPQQEIFIPAHFSRLYCATGFNTVLSDDSKQEKIGCVEHLMSAIFGVGLTNVIVEVRGDEIPIFDGSAKVFAEAILHAGLEVIGDNRPAFFLDKPYYWHRGNVHLLALPSPELRFSYTQNYEDRPFLGTQFYTFPFSEKGFDHYLNEIAPARTYAFYEQVQSLIESGRVKGGSLDCVIVVKGEQVLNPEGLRFKDELVRHKVLDMMGDLALLGKLVIGHFIGIRSGHEANSELGKEIAESLSLQEVLL